MQANRTTFVIGTAEIILRWWRDHMQDMTLIWR
jgi:hypothetical protein